MADAVVDIAIEHGDPEGIVLRVAVERGDARDGIEAILTPERALECALLLVDAAEQWLQTYGGKDDGGTPTT